MCIDRADWARFLVLDGSWLWCDRLLVLNSDLETELELGLGRTVELLVDGGVAWVEDNECRSTIGVTFEDGFGGWWDRKEEAKLVIKAHVRGSCHTRQVTHRERDEVDLPPG